MPEVYRNVEKDDEVIVDNNTTVLNSTPTIVGGQFVTGSVIVPSGGYIRSGQTDYDTGTGFFMGSVSNTPKMSLGNSSGNKLTWDGSTLGITGTITGSTLQGNTLQTAASGQRIRIISATGTTPTQAANSFGLIDASDNLICSFGSVAGSIGYIQPFSDVIGLVIASNITSTNNLLSITQSSALSSASAVNISDGGTNYALSVGITNSSSNSPVMSLTQNATVSTNFKKIMNFASTTFYRSDGTTPDGNLSGTAGDICFNGPSGQPFYCNGSTATSWTGM